MQNRKKAPSGLLTAREAIEIIGIPQTAFFELVKGGTIRKIIPPGRKEGFYSKAEVENYGRNLKAFSEPFQGENLDFGLALNEDLPSIHELVASVSGGYPHAVPVEVLKGWIRKNPQSIHILRKGTEIVGYISMFPLPEETIIDRLSGKLFNRTIPIDDIQPFTPNTTIRLYIAEMAVKHSQDHIKQHEPDPDNPDPEARKLGLRLIREAGRFIADLKKQNIKISELYAVGTSRFGIQMSRDLGMEPMNLPEGTRKDRIPFKMDLGSKTSSIFVRTFIVR